MADSLEHLLEGAGIRNITIPRGEFIKEHTHLIKLLKKPRRAALLREAAAQEKELRSVADGGSKASGFIQRMMAENALKHRGQYGRPSEPLAKDSTMNRPVAFVYKKLANSDQGGENSRDYGASPFIQTHFKSKKRVPFTRKRHSEWAEMYEKGVSFDRMAARRGQFIAPPPKKVEAPAPAPPPSPPKAAKAPLKPLLPTDAAHLLSARATILKSAPKKKIDELLDTPASGVDQMFGDIGKSRLWEIISSLDADRLRDVLRARFPSQKLPKEDRLATELLEKLAYDLK